MGENLVRCLVDKNWVQREAAAREIERKVAESIKDNTNVALPRDLNTLTILCESLESMLNDTVARVYQCALRLLQVQMHSHFCFNH
jgi:hypothetical protein